MTAYNTKSKRGDPRRYTITKYRKLHGVQWKVTEQKQKHFIWRSYEKRIDGRWMFVNGSRRDIKG